MWGDVDLLSDFVKFHSRYTRMVLRGAPTSPGPAALTFPKAGGVMSNPGPFIFWTAAGQVLQCRNEQTTDGLFEGHE